MQIIQLTAENIKRLSAVSITPEGGLTVIGGRNANGKSSVLDAVEMALGGSKTIPGKPIRNGQKKGKVTVDLGENGTPRYLVERTFTTTKDGEGKSTLKVKSVEGAEFPSPQKMLDELCSQIAFDPLEFSRLKPRDQAESLRGLLGDAFNRTLTELDDQRKALFDERTLVNRQLKQAQAQLAGLAKADDAGEIPDAVDTAALMEKLTEINNHNADVDVVASNLLSVDREIAVGQERLAGACAEVERLKKLLAQAEAKVAELNDKLGALSVERGEIDAQYAEMKPISTAEINAQIASAASVNAARQKALDGQRQRRELIDSVRRLESQSEGMTGELAEIQSKKLAALQAAPFPIPGLGFDEGGVTYSGLPFEQASGAEKLRVSVAMGMALNPTLRVLLIRDGSLLDSDGLRMVSDMASAGNGRGEYQILIERAGDEPTGCEVWIEDGAVGQQPQRKLFSEATA